MSFDAILFWWILFSVLFPILLPAFEWADNKADFYMTECRNARKAFIWSTIAFIIAIWELLSFAAMIGLVICMIVYKCLHP